MTTDPGDYVIDLFSGGGSAGVAAKQMGRKYLGADIDKRYARASVEKNKKVKSSNSEESVRISYARRIQDETESNPRFRCGDSDRMFQYC